MLDELLLALGDGCLLAVEHRLLSAVRVLQIVEDAHISKIQGLLNDLVAVDPACAVGVGGLNVAPVVAFALDIPLAGVLGIVNMDVPLTVARGGEQLKGELLDELQRQP